MSDIFLPPINAYSVKHRCNCSGLVMAGSADFKSELMSSDLFDPRLLKAVVKTVDVSYGGESGFNQAIELSVEALSSVKLVQEKKLLQKYFDEISQVPCFLVTGFLHLIAMPYFKALRLVMDMAWSSHVWSFTSFQFRVDE